MIYNYILGFDTEDNNWFHNVEAEFQEKVFK